MRLCIYKCYLACTVSIAGSVSGIYRRIRAFLKNILTHIQNLVYPYHIQNPDIFLSQTYPRYIQNTISNIFHLGRLIQFWMHLSLKDARLYGVFNVIFQTYSGMFKIYSAIFILLRHTKNLSILRNILLQRYSGIF